MTSALVLQSSFRPTAIDCIWRRLTELSTALSQRALIRFLPIPTRVQFQSSRSQQHAVNFLPLPTRTSSSLSVGRRRNSRLGQAKVGSGQGAGSEWDPRKLWFGVGWTCSDVAGSGRGCGGRGGGGTGWPGWVGGSGGWGRLGVIGKLFSLQRNRRPEGWSTENVNTNRGI